MQDIQILDQQGSHDLLQIAKSLAHIKMGSCHVNQIAIDMEL